MNKYWFLVVIASLFEVMWVIGLKHANNALEWVGTAIAIIISFGGLIQAGKQLPTSTVYAVFVGLGTAGTVLTEIILFNGPFSWTKLGLIVLLLVGIIGLKLVTGNDNTETELKGEKPS